MLMIRPGKRATKPGESDLHVAGEDHQVGAPLQDLEHARLGPGPGLPGRSARAGRGRRTAPRRRAGRGGWRRRPGSRRAARRASSSRGDRASAWSWRETSTATLLPLGVAGEAPLHGHGPPHLRLEELPEAGERHVEPLGLELEPHEVGPGRLLGGVLVEVHHVGAVAEEEGGDRGHDARAVGAADEEDGVHGALCTPARSRRGTWVSWVGLTLASMDDYRRRSRVARRSCGEETSGAGGRASESPGAGRSGARRAPCRARATGPTARRSTPSPGATGSPRSCSAWRPCSCSPRWPPSRWSRWPSAASGSAGVDGLHLPAQRDHLGVDPPLHDEGRAGRGLRHHRQHRAAGGRSTTSASSTRKGASPSPPCRASGASSWTSGPRAAAPATRRTRA